MTSRPFDFNLDIIHAFLRDSRNSQHCTRYVIKTRLDETFVSANHRAKGGVAMDKPPSSTIIAMPYFP